MKRLWNRSKHELVDAIAYGAGRTTAFLSLTGEVRRSVSWIQDRFIAGMIDELESQQLSNKVIADMMGMSPRTYQRRKHEVQAATHPPQNLWFSVYRKLQKEPMTKQELLLKYNSSNEAIILALLRDMQKHGHLDKTEEGQYVVQTTPETWDDKTLFGLVMLEKDFDTQLNIDALVKETGIEAARWEKALASYEEWKQSRHVDPKDRPYSDADELVDKAFTLMFKQLMKLMTKPKGSHVSVAMCSISKNDEATIEKVKAKIEELKNQVVTLTEGGTPEDQPYDGPQGEEELLTWMFGATPMSHKEIYE